MWCMKVVKLLSLLGANPTKNNFFSRVSILLKSLKNTVFLNFCLLSEVLHIWFWLWEGFSAFFYSVNLAYDASLFLATFFGLRGGSGALLLSTWLDWLCDDFVEIPGPVSPILRSEIRSSSSVSFVFFSQFC